MKLKTCIKDHKPYLILEYENNEYKNVKAVCEELNLEIAKTTKGMGANATYDYYRESDTELLNYIRKSFMTNYGMYDSINEPFYSGGLNIAIFRIIPKNNKVYIPLTKFLTVVELNKIVEEIRRLYDVIFNICINKEIKIKVSK